MVFETLERTGWVMVMSAYEDDMAAAALTQRAYLAIGGAVVALLLAGVLVVIVRLLITHPVQGLLGYASEIAGGDLNAELNGVYRFEFKELCGPDRDHGGGPQEQARLFRGRAQGADPAVRPGGRGPQGALVNQQMCELIGRDGNSEDFVGMTPGQFFYEDKSRETMADKAIKEKRQLSSEIEYETLGGAKKNIMRTTTPFFDMDGVMLALWACG